MNCTKEQLLEKIKMAYTITGYVPIYGSYYECRDIGECACPMTALVNANRNEKSPPIHGPAGVFQDASKLLGVDLLWVNSFVMGFDAVQDFTVTRHRELDEDAFKIGQYISTQLNPKGNRYANVA